MEPAQVALLIGGAVVIIIIARCIFDKKNCAFCGKKDCSGCGTTTARVRRFPSRRLRGSRRVSGGGCGCGSPQLGAGNAAGMDSNISYEDQPAFQGDLSDYRTPLDTSDLPAASIDYESQPAFQGSFSEYRVPLNPFDPQNPDASNPPQYDLDLVEPYTARSTILNNRGTAARRQVRPDDSRYYGGHNGLIHANSVEKADISLEDHLSVEDAYSGSSHKVVGAIPDNRRISVDGSGERGVMYATIRKKLSPQIVHGFLGNLQKATHSDQDLAVGVY